MEKKHLCKRCGYVGASKQSLKSHLIKKKECDATLDDIERDILIEELIKKEIKRHICEGCNRELSSRQNLYRHNKICKVDNDKSKIKKLENKIDEMDNLVKALIKKKETKIINNNTNNGTIYNIVIENINPKGEENLTYITEKKIRDIISKNSNMLSSLVEEVHFNIDHPENWNYYIPNIRTEKALVYRGERFKEEDKRKSLIELIAKNRDFLLKEVNELDNLMESRRQMILEHLKTYDKELDTLEHIIRKSEKVAYDNREYFKDLKIEIDRRYKKQMKERII